MAWSDYDYLASGAQKLEEALRPCIPKADTDELHQLIEDCFTYIGQVEDDRLELDERMAAMTQLMATVKSLPDVLLPPRERSLLVLDLESAMEAERANNDISAAGPPSINYAF